MTDEKQVRLNSGTVCPIMRDILNGRTVKQICDERGLAPQVNEQDSVLFAVAFIGCGSIYAASAGAETVDLVDAADMFATVLVDAHDKAKERVGR